MKAGCVASTVSSPANTGESFQIPVGRKFTFGARRCNTRCFGGDHRYKRSRFSQSSCDRSDVVNARIPELNSIGLGSFCLSTACLSSKGQIAREFDLAFAIGERRAAAGEGAHLPQGKCGSGPTRASGLEIVATAGEDAHLPQGKCGSGPTRVSRLEIAPVFIR